jgi:serine/threonine protein kinase
LVYQVCARKTGKFFALKVVDNNPLDLRAMRGQLHKEVEQLQAHRDTPHVVQLLEVTETPERTLLRFELCEKSLHDVVTLAGAVEEEQACGWIREASVGVQCFHEVGLIHRDLKLGNLLLDYDGTLRICDFGWCCLESELNSGIRGTPQYAPPEMRDPDGPLHTTSIDIYSLGACLQHLLLGRLPDVAEVVIPSGGIPSRGAAAFIAELMQGDPEARPTIEEVLEHPLLQEKGRLMQFLKDGHAWLTNPLGMWKGPEAGSSSASSARASQAKGPPSSVVSTPDHVSMPDSGPPSSASSDGSQLSPAHIGGRRKPSFAPC